MGWVAIVSDVVNVREDGLRLLLSVLAGNNLQFCFSSFLKVLEYVKYFTF